MGHQRRESSAQPSPRCRPFGGSRRTRVEGGFVAEVGTPGYELAAVSLADATRDDWLFERIETENPSPIVGLPLFALATNLLERGFDVLA
jgi:hypothetical protein